MERLLSCGGFRARSNSRERSSSQQHKIVFKGWLVKSPPVPSDSSIFSKYGMRQLQPKWHRRYFVLFATDPPTTESYRLHYFKDEQQINKLGSVNLSQTENITTMVVPPDIVMQNIASKYIENKSRPLPFFGLETMQHNTMRTYYLLAEHLDNMERWVDHLTLACGLREEGVDEEDFYPENPMPYPTNTLMSSMNMNTYPRPVTGQMPTTMMGYNSMLMPNHNSMRTSAGHPSLPMMPPRHPSPTNRQVYTNVPTKSQQDTYYDMAPNPLSRDNVRLPPLPTDSVYGVPMSDKGEHLDDGIYRINSPTRRYMQSEIEDEYKVPTNEEMRYNERDSVYKIPTELDPNYINLEKSVLPAAPSPARQPSLKPRKFSQKYKTKPLIVQRLAQEKQDRKSELQNDEDEDEKAKHQDYVNVQKVMAKVNSKRSDNHNEQPLDLSVHHPPSEDDHSTIQLPQRRTLRTSNSSESDDDEKQGAAAAKQHTTDYVKLDLEHLNNKNSESSSSASIQYTEVDSLRTKAISEMRPKVKAEVKY